MSDNFIKIIRKYLLCRNFYEVKCGVGVFYIILDLFIFEYFGYTEDNFY